MPECNHADTYLLPEPWPTGDTIEVCNCCGMSRGWLALRVSPWLRVDLVRRRKEIKARIDTIMAGVRNDYKSGPGSLQ